MIKYQTCLILHFGEIDLWSYVNIAPNFV